MTSKGTQVTTLTIGTYDVPVRLRVSGSWTEFSGTMAGAEYNASTLVELEKKLKAGLRLKKKRLNIEAMQPHGTGSAVILIPVTILSKNQRTGKLMVRRDPPGGRPETVQENTYALFYKRLPAQDGEADYYAELRKQEIELDRKMRDFDKKYRLDVINLIRDLEAKAAEESASMTTEEFNRVNAGAVEEDEPEEAR